MTRRVLTVGSLFAGIGGIELGLERTGGFKTVWQVEKDDYARRVLAKHWPNVRRHDDVCTFPPEGEWGCDLICGGFPCQDISNAGKRAGIDGERSGLWAEYARIIGVVRPRFVLVENVAALLSSGMGRVVGDLATCGYDCEWDCLPAVAFGAPHIRERVFLVAHASRPRTRHQGRTNSRPQRKQANASEPEALRPSHGATCSGRSNSGGEDVPDSGGIGLERYLQARNGSSACFGIKARSSLARAGQQGRRKQWGIEPSLGRVANGIPSRVDRLRCLGNAVVPQVAQWIGERILESLE